VRELPVLPRFDRLELILQGALGDEDGRNAMRRLRRFQDLYELDLPIILLVGGATGTGKSTVATDVAYRLGITRVTSTDSPATSNFRFASGRVPCTRARRRPWSAMRSVG